MTEIYSIITKEILFKDDSLSLKELVEKHKKDLYGAYLYGAYLYGANLGKANLRKRSITDPHFCTIQNHMIPRITKISEHTRWITSMVRLR